MRTESVRASSTTWRPSALPSATRSVWYRSAADSRWLALALSSNWLRTVSFCSAISLRTGGTTYLVMIQTMTAKPTSCPIKVDNGDQPSETVEVYDEDGEPPPDGVPPTETPSTRLASVADRVSTEARRFGAMASLCTLS